MTIISVIVPIWQSFGLTLQEVYELQAIFGGVMLVLDVPTGYVSDLFGRKSSLIVVGILNGLAFLVFSLSHTFWGFACFEVLGATAMSLYSGCDIALLYDSLEASGVQSNTQTNLLGKRLFYSQIGETVASLLGGALVVYSLRWPVRVNAVLAWIPLLIALTVDEPPRKMLQTKKHFENFRFIFRSVFGHSRLLSFLFFFTIFYGFCSFAALWSLQGYWKNLGVSVPFFGVLWAGLNLIAAVSGRYAFQAERKLGPARIVLAIGILPIIGYLGMALFQNYWGIFLGAAFYLMRGLNSVVIQDALNARVPNEIRATVN